MSIDIDQIKGIEQNNSLSVQRVKKQRFNSAA
jgi:hypothetical protein